jgi:hypothetical protein
MGFFELIAKLLSGSNGVATARNGYLGGIVTAFEKTAYKNKKANTKKKTYTAL